MWVGENESARFWATVLNILDEKPMRLHDGPVVLPVGLFGRVNMWIAVFAGAGVPVSCLLNSIRSLRR